MDDGEGWGVGNFLKEVLIIVVGALILSTLLRMFLLQVFSIPSQSMETTLNVDDRVAVQKVIPHQRGDVVVFRDELEWLGNPDRFNNPAWQDALIFVGLMPDTASNHLVKRVIGTEGDHVVCCDADGRITVNDQPLDESSYLYTSPEGLQDEPSDVPFDVVVPAGRLFVLGDHRSASADSRCHLDEDTLGVRALGGFPRADSVVGGAWVTIFPFDRWRSFTAPDTFAAIPSPASAAPEQPQMVGAAPSC